MQENGIYGAMAPFYDALNGEIDYRKWANAIEACLSKHFSGKTEMILDLCCGTGSMTIELAKRGYDMIGVDLSSEMLDIARSRSEACGLKDRILWLNQDASEFELYGTVEAVVCCLDSINHITDRAKLSSCFHWVHNYLVPGGLFLFDVNGEKKFTEVYGDKDYVLEDRNVLCAWQNRYSKKSGLCKFYISLFRHRENGLYSRQDLIQTERYYSRDTLAQMLKENGLELIDIQEGGNSTFAYGREFYLARAIK